MINLDEYQTLVKTKDRLRRLTDQAQGALDQYTKRLEEEVGCEIEEAKKLVERIKNKIDLKLPKFQKAKEEFWIKWADFLSNT